jgi:putative addiction module component (TIGR02574 family)
MNDERVPGDSASAGRAGRTSVEDISSLRSAERLVLIEPLLDSLAKGDVPLSTVQHAKLKDRITTVDEERPRGITWRALKAGLAARATRRPR